MKVTVKGDMGIEMTAEVATNPHATIEVLLNDVTYATGIDASRVLLANDSRILPAEETLESLGIKDGDTLLLIPRDPAGC